MYLNFKFSSIVSIFPPKKLHQPTCLPAVSEHLFPNCLLYAVYYKKFLICDNLIGKKYYLVVLVST